MNNKTSENQGFGLIPVIVIIIITAAITSVATGIIMLNNNPTYVTGRTDVSNDKDLQEFINVYETLLSKYYDSNIDKAGMLKSAEEAMTKYLGDKYTTYLNDYEYNEIINELSGKYNGIGVLIENNKVIKVTESSPAEKAGILAGDIIIKVNDTDVNESDSETIKNLITSDQTRVTLGIDRNGEILNFKIEKADLINPSILSEVIEGTNTGYIYLKNFSENLGEQVSKAVVELENKGINSLIIDVRDNAGGYLQAADDVASLFLANGKIIYSLETSNNRFSYSDKTDEKRNYKIAVLINNNSASASEVLAAALKDSYGATIVGEKSYGKGKVQQVMNLNNGGSVKYTSAKWLTPNGICIDGIGITPDYEVSYEPGEKYDSQVLKAIEILK